MAILCQKTLKKVYAIEKKEKEKSYAISVENNNNTMMLTCCQVALKMNLQKK